MLLSPEHRHKLAGIERADSVTWNPHKLMGCLLQCSACFIREDVISFLSIISYLFIEVFSYSVFQKWTLYYFHCYICCLMLTREYFRTLYNYFFIRLNIHRVMYWRTYVILQKLTKKNRDRGYHPIRIGISTSFLNLIKFY